MFEDETGNEVELVFAPVGRILMRIGAYEAQAKERFLDNCEEDIGWGISDWREFLDGRCNMLRVTVCRRYMDYLEYVKRAKDEDRGYLQFHSWDRYEVEEAKSMDKKRRAELRDAIGKKREPIDPRWFEENEVTVTPSHEEGSVVMAEGWDRVEEQSNGTVTHNDRGVTMNWNVGTANNLDQILANREEENLEHTR
jgi:hypothetical protein